MMKPTGPSLAALLLLAVQGRSRLTAPQRRPA